MSTPNEQGSFGNPVGGENGDTGDLGCILATQVWLPTDGSSPPWPCIQMWRASLFRNNGFATFGRIAESFQPKGVMLIGHAVRQMVGGATGGSGIPGQTTDGRWSQQTNDVAQATRAIRADPRCNGFILGLSGSGGGFEVLYKTLFGTQGDDLFDAAVALSPVTDVGDREADVDNTFKVVACDYLRTNPDDDSQVTLDLETSRSPIAFVHPNMPPVFHYNGGMESMPASQFDRFAAAVAAVGGQNYVTYFVESSDQHSFHAWDAPGINARDKVVPFFDLAYAFWQGSGGGTPPPPPPVSEYITIQVTGLSPGIPMTAHVNAVDKASGLAGGVKDYDFITDRDLGSLVIKDYPDGNYVYVPAPGGVPGTIEGRAWLDFDYVDGARLDTNAQIVSVGNNVFDWSVVRSFLTSLSNKGKFGGVAVAAGLTTPLQWYQRGVRVFTLSGGGTIPIVWDQGYITLYKKLIISFGSNFNAMEALSYVVMGGLGQNVSTFLVGNADYAALNAIALQDGFGNLAEAWNFGAQVITQYWMQGCPNTRCFLQVDYPTPVEQEGLNAISSLIDYCITQSRSRFGGVIYPKLTGASDRSDDLVDLVASANNKVQLGYAFQFPSANPDCDPTQDPGSYDAETGLRNAANAGISLNGAFEEFKEEDILTTTPPYPADLETFQISLKANTHNP